MDLQNFIYLLFTLVWLSGLIWAGGIAFILTGNGDYARIGSIGQFYKDIISEDER